jgi:hypothetical protein
VVESGAFLGIESGEELVFDQAESDEGDERPVDRVAGVAFIG